MTQGTLVGDGAPLHTYGNLFTNGGHGTLGWTMACGSACVLADLVDGREPEIEASDLSASRYAR